MRVLPGTASENWRCLFFRRVRRWQAKLPRLVLASHAHDVFADASFQNRDFVYYAHRGPHEKELERTKDRFVNSVSRVHLLSRFYHRFCAVSKHFTLVLAQRVDDRGAAAAYRGDFGRE